MVRTGSALGLVMFAGPALAGNFAFSTIQVSNGFPSANAINDTNIVVGNGGQESSNNYVGFTWVNGTVTLVRLPKQSPRSTFAFVGVNNNGLAIGVEIQVHNPAYRSFTYDINTAVLKQIAAPSGYYLEATAINNDNIVVGQAHSFQPPYVSPIFELTPHKPVVLIPVGTAGDSYYPRGVAASGEIAGYAYDGGGLCDNGFSYLNGTYTSLNAPDGGTAPCPSSINSGGVIAGGYQPKNGQEAGFVANGSSVESVRFPHSDNSFVIGVTSAGVVIGQNRPSTGPSEGYVLQNGVYSSFGYPGATFTEIKASNSQGSVAGFYIDSAGARHAFVGICTADQAPCTQ